MKRLLLSYACCLSIAASAATISSPEVGQFFKLPGWSPTAVDSEHTPGSPETVVDVYTNVVKTTEWRFGPVQWFEPGSLRSVDFVPTNAVQPTYVSGRGWDLGPSLSSLSGVVPPSEGSNWYSAPGGSVVEAGEGADSLTVYVRYTAARRVGGVMYSIEMNFNWTLTAAKRETEPAYAGKGVRPFRLVPEMFSSFYATFEAYYERLYYTSCGSRNVWDVSEWGPRNPDHLFWFGHTNWYHSSFYEPQTNRTVRTRRLVESDNILRMYGWIRDMRGWYRPERPSWSNYHNSAFISTTVFDDMGLSVGWPDMSSWGSPDTVLGQLNTYQWERTLLTFEDVREAVPDRDRTFQLDWSTGYIWGSFARGAWDAVNFGEYPFYDSAVYDTMLRPGFADHEKAVTNTTEEVLAYPWAERSLVTNDFIATRRLIPGSWGRANQVLACYDRSIYFPPFENMVVTGAYQQAERNRFYVRGGDPIRVAVYPRFYDEGGEFPYVIANGSVSIPVPSSDEMSGEYTNVTSEAVSRQYPVAYSSPTSARGDVSLDESLYLAPDDMWAFVSLYSILDSMNAIPISGEVECYLGENYIYLGLAGDGAAWFSNSALLRFPDGRTEFDSTLFPFAGDPEAWFGASYSMLKSHENVQVSRLDKSTIGDPVPGNFSRVSGGGSDEPGCSLHFLLSSAVGAGKNGSYVSADVPVPSLLTYYEFMHGLYHRDDDQWTSGYMAYTSRYGNETRYRDVVDEAYSRVWAKCSTGVDAALLGPGWRDSEGMTAIGDDEVRGVFSGLSITNGTRIGWHFDPVGGLGHIDFPGSPWPNQVLVSVTVTKDTPTSSSIRITKITCQDVVSFNVFDVTDEESIAQARLQTFRNWYSVEVPGHETKKSPGAISDGRVWGAAKVDWNWNCLRLNKDE